MVRELGVGNFHQARQATACALFKSVVAGAMAGFFASAGSLAGKLVGEVDTHLI